MLRVAIALGLMLAGAGWCRAEDKVPLQTGIPEEILIGTPPDVLAMLFPGLEKPPEGRRPDFLVPRGTTNLALRKPVTSSEKEPEFGTCWDTFTVAYQYPDNVGIAFSSRQFNGHGTQPEGIRNRMFGSEGVLETAYGGQVMIRGNNFYRGGSSPGIFRDGAVQNIAAFHEAIQGGDHSNPTVAPSVRSNLVTLLGRTAAYRGKVVTWDKLLAENERLDAGLEGLKD